MNRLLLPALLTCIPILACAKAPDEPAQRPTKPAAQLGVFEGTGRACTGRLTITPRTLAWKNTFLPCPATAYSLVEARRTDIGRQWIYELRNPPKRCFYRVVKLEKRDAASAWNIAGFSSIEAYKANSDVDRLNCYMVKLD